MVRTPYCDENGMKKGTWTPEEDKILVAYVTRYGCWNWRQLPRFAGLKRCGKSCRLRWMNYLRPNLKRGNYTKEEEEIIVRLHETLGNRWSAIAAQLPGRTDNEIKNYWHTHLKKRVKVINNNTMSLNSPTVSSHNVSTDQQFESNRAKMDLQDINSSSPDDPETKPHNIIPDHGSPLIMSPQQSSSDVSTVPTDTSNTTSTTETSNNNYLVAESYYNPLEETTYAEFSDNFWTEPFFADNSYTQYDVLASLIDTEFLSSEFDANFLFSTGPGNNFLYEEPTHAGPY